MAVTSSQMDKNSNTLLLEYEVFMDQKKLTGREIAASIFSNIGDAFRPAPESGMGAGISKLGETIGDVIKKRKKQKLLETLDAGNDASPLAAKDTFLA